MKQRRGSLLFISYGIGNLLLVLTRIFDDNFTDFEIGFLEGLSIVFLVIGTLHLVKCAVKKQWSLSLTIIK